MAGTMGSLLMGPVPKVTVSMESGLDGRNNAYREVFGRPMSKCLNGVRPRWPEQWSQSRALRLWVPEASQWSPA